MSAHGSTRSFGRLAGISSFRTASAPHIRPGVVASSSRAASTFTPNSNSSNDTLPLSRPPRPASPAFFTGRPEYNEALSSLERTLGAAQTLLRQQYIWPLPPRLPYVQPPAVSWRAAESLSFPVRTNNDYRRVIEVLNALHHVRHVAELAGSNDVAAQVDAAVAAYEREDRVESAATRAAKREVTGEKTTSRNGIDAFGRSYATGRRKESSARVWVVPSSAGAAVLDTPAPEYTDDEPIAATQVPESAILINHLALPIHFSRPADRDIVLRPLRLTGLIGAYNVFALVRGGGTTGQSGAVALALARALVQLREDVQPVLENDGALMRDPRMVERKKTGLAKARKRYTWVKR